MFAALKKLLIKPFEGLHKVVGGLVYAYLCPANVPTQGYGVVVESLNVAPITPEEAEAKLDAILPGYAALAYSICPNLRRAPLGLQIAVIDFVFNLGPTRFRASTLKRKLDASDWEAAMREFPKWVFGGGRKLPGLERRAAARIMVAQMDAAKLA